jgi:ribosomal protein S12 methylthiotransferase accessory factor
MTRAAAEREASLAVALDAAEEAVARLDSTLAVDYLERGTYCVTQAVLRDRDGRVKATGAGKGTGEQAKASAAFETLEHHFFMTANQTHASDLEVRSIETLVSQPSAEQDLMFAYLEAVYPDSAVGCGLYAAVGDAEATILVPLFFVDPTYCSEPLPGDRFIYEQFRRYASSNGHATGATLNEALLHGLLEVIERDALSRFFLGRYQHGRRYTNRLVTSQSLPGDLAALKEELCRRFGGRVDLLDITTDIEVPTYIAEFRGGRVAPLSAYGCGCSLGGSYALERSLTELLQVLVDPAEPQTRANSQFLRAIQRWRQLASLVLDPLDGDIHYVEALQDIPPPSVVDALALVSERLTSRGYQPVYRVTTPVDYPVTGVSVYLPGAERFFLARVGHRIAPTSARAIQGSGTI